MSSSITSDKTLKALARELKAPLTVIARESELKNESNILRQAQQAMVLIDSYLLTAQTEYGQLFLPLEPTGVGSVLYDVSQEVRSLSVSGDVLVNMTSNHQDGLVMTNRKALRVALSCLAQLVETSTKNVKNPEICLASYRKRNGTTVAGVLSSNFSFEPKDIRRAKVLFGDSHMAASTQLADSGVRLAIAQQIGDSLGARLVTLRRRGLQGLGFELPRSEQLQLV